MAVDGTSIKNDIDTNLANKGYRGVRIVNVITALKNMVDWVMGAVNGNLTTWNKIGTSGPAGTNADDVFRMGKVIVGRSTDDSTGTYLQSTSTSAGVLVASTLNATVLNQELHIGPFGVATRRYFKICTLAPSGGNNLSRVDVDIIVGAWSAGTKSRHKISIENRDGFASGYTIEGIINDCGLAIFRDSQGNHQVYLNLANGFNMAIVNVPLNNFAILTPTLPEELSSGQPATPAGTLVMNTADTNTFQPVYTFSLSRMKIYAPMTVNGFTRLGGDTNSGVKITGVKTASGLTLKTGRYLELTLEDGTVVKVAEVN